MTAAELQARRWLRIALIESIVLIILAFVLPFSIAGKLATIIPALHAWSIYYSYRKLRDRGNLLGSFDRALEHFVGHRRT
jgi:hypothetical protein